MLPTLAAQRPDAPVPMFVDLFGLYFLDYCVFRLNQSSHLNNFLRGLPVSTGAAPLKKRPAFGEWV